jgi:hypothetical protein
MTRKELYELHRKMCGEARFLLSTKNQDRASAEDPFTNLRDDGLIGIVARMQDKVSRLRTFAKTGRTSDTDKIYDDLIDLMNYANLYEGLRRDTEEHRGSKRRANKACSGGDGKGRTAARPVPPERPAGDATGS